ncbi:hypothetical protein EB796_004567 [Bugula neritina]|uniref:Uncharacterized protein n=1 Tax=Bugula neritina TaxID=10212 RepID=A0A7J7KFS6_BUGNE|nr:hypothetical protein EB796_004567 [Bugula neritina]
MVSWLYLAESPCSVIKYLSTVLCFAYLTLIVYLRVVLSIGSVPPGARFDPFGPDIEDDRRNPFRSGPRPDHMRPPDFEDPFI